MNKTEEVSVSEIQVFQKEIQKFTSKLSDLVTDILKEQVTKADLQKKLDLLLEERIFLSEPFSIYSDTSSCKAFLGDLSPNLKNKALNETGHGKEPQLDFLKNNIDFDFTKATANDSLKSPSPNCSPTETVDNDKYDEELEFSAFMNSNVCSNNYLVKFDFAPELPSHVQFLDQTKNKPVNFYQGECSTSASKKVYVNKSSK